MLYPDYDPARCADSTPIFELVRAFNEISEALLIVRGEYSMSKSKQSTLNVLENMTYSKENFEWYMQYWYYVLYNHKRFGKDFTSLLTDCSQQLLRVEQQRAGMRATETPYVFRNIITDGSIVFEDNPYHNSEYSEYTERLSQSNDPRSVSRAIIVMMEPVFEEFLFNIPGWYAQTRTLVFQGYDEENRRHIKVTNDGKRLRYYTSIISDNFKEVTDVPPEIDKIFEYVTTSKLTSTLGNGAQVDDFI